MVAAPNIGSPIELNSTEGLTVGKQIHKSKENVCSLGEYKQQTVVVKRAIISRPDSIDKFEEEVDILCKPEFKGTVVQPLAVVRSPPHYSILLPFHERGSLCKIIEDHGPLSTEMVVALGVDMIRALVSVHDAKLVHRDFKTANVLVNNEWKALLTDFGSAMPCVSSSDAMDVEVDSISHGRAKRARGGQPSGGFYKQVINGTTLGYAAPEILCNKVATQASDIYGFAITMCEILTGIAPYEGAEKENADFHTVLDASYSEQALILAITQDHLRPNLVSCGERGVPMDLLTLIRKCWNSDPSVRPNSKQVLEQLESLAEKLGIDTSIGSARENISRQFINRCQEKEKAMSISEPSDINLEETKNRKRSTSHVVDDVAEVPALSRSDVKKFTSDLSDGSFLQSNPYISCGGFATSGRRGADKMEDRHSVLHMKLQQTNNITVCSVFDGHGGPACAEYSNNQLPSLVLQSLYQSLSGESSTEEERASCVKKNFVQVDESFRSSKIADKSGSTAISVGIWWNHAKDRVNALVANAGDCRAVVCRVVDGKDFAVPISVDQCADNPLERDRIIAAGGKIIKTSDGTNRVQGHIQVTRSLGDAVMKPYGVCAEPQVDEFQLNPSTDEFLIIATDGVFDTLSNEQAIKAVRDTAKEPGLAAKRISGEALAHGSRDNISCIVVFLREFDDVDRIF